MVVDEGRENAREKGEWKRRKCSLRALKLNVTNTWLRSPRREMRVDGMCEAVDALGYSEQEVAGTNLMHY
jgi:hypothetical protein